MDNEDYLSCEPLIEGKVKIIDVDVDLMEARDCEQIRVVIVEDEYCDPGSFWAFVTGHYLDKSDYVVGPTIRYSSDNSSFVYKRITHDELSSGFVSEDMYRRVASDIAEQYWYDTTEEGKHLDEEETLKLFGRLFLGQSISRSS